MIIAIQSKNSNTGKKKVLFLHFFSNAHSCHGDFRTVHTLCSVVDIQVVLDCHDKTCVTCVAKLESPPFARVRKYLLHLEKVLRSSVTEGQRQRATVFTIVFVIYPRMVTQAAPSTPIFNQKIAMGLPIIFTQNRTAYRS